MKRSILVAATLLSVSSAFAQISNGSFETSNVASNGYRYASDNIGLADSVANVVASPWAFVGGSGVIANDGPTSSNTAWGSAASSGSSYAFLQNIGSISQTFTSSSAADYTFSFDLGLRGSQQGGTQTVSVLLDGQTVWSGSPTSNWSSYSGSIPGVASGTHLLTFAGTNLNKASDTTAFVDNVSMTVTAVPAPETYAMLMAGLGLMASVSRRRMNKKA